MSKSEKKPQQEKGRKAAGQAGSEAQPASSEASKPAESAGTAQAAKSVPEPRLHGYYKQVVRPALKKAFSYPNDNAVPKITKVVLNMGVGKARENPKMLDALVADMAAIAGQRPIKTKAKAAIANFKLREGMPIGCMVTLRRAQMYEFLDRLITIACPRIRDFRGLSPKAFDGRGNYSLGLTEQIVFPEIQSDKVEFFNGMNVVVCTTAATDNEARELLRLVGFPFRGLEVAGINAASGRS